jgi:GTP-binding protein
LEKADLILLVVDGQTGILPEDKELALVLQKLDKPVLLVCNKIDAPRHAHQVNDFFALGLGVPYPVSAASGSGTGDFLDVLIKKIKWPIGRPKKEVADDSIRVAIIGKPNAGKSSLVNKILGEKRVIVSPVAQTTREPQDTTITYKNREITLIDTAGLRKKGKIKPGLEKMATDRTTNMLNAADVVLLVTEVDKPLSRQDSHIAGDIKSSGAGIVLVLNKWDLVDDKDDKSDNRVKKYYQTHFPFLSFVPIIFTSAETGKNVDKILDQILEVEAEKQKEIPSEKLEEIIQSLIRKHKPMQAKGPSRPKIKSLTQTGVNPPEFTVTVGPRQSVQQSYLRFIENQLRYNFGFSGVPVIIRVRTLTE